MDREKREVVSTRMVVEIDGRWNPTALFTRIQSAGFPIQGVKPGDFGRYTLSFGELLTSEALYMIQQDIMPFFAGDPSRAEVSKNEKRAPKPVEKRVNKTHYIHHRR